MVVSFLVLIASDVIGTRSVHVCAGSCPLATESGDIDDLSESEIDEMRLLQFPTDTFVMYLRE